MSKETVTSSGSIQNVPSTGGHAEVVSVLLEAKANPNIRGVYNATPLHAAVKGTHITQYIERN